MLGQSGHVSPLFSFSGGCGRISSCVTDSAPWPDGALVWEFNYRGELDFLRQAQANQADRSLSIEDGWIYFIHGWTRVIAEVFHVDIPTSGPVFDDLCHIAQSIRK